MGAKLHLRTKFCFGCYADGPPWNRNSAITITGGRGRPPLRTVGFLRSKTFGKDKQKRFLDFHLIRLLRIHLLLKEKAVKRQPPCIFERTTKQQPTVGATVRPQKHSKASFHSISAPHRRARAALQQNLCRSIPARRRGRTVHLIRLLRIHLLLKEKAFLCNFLLFYNGRIAFFFGVD